MTNYILNFMTSFGKLGWLIDLVNSKYLHLVWTKDVEYCKKEDSGNRKTIFQVPLKFID